MLNIRHLTTMIFAFAFCLSLNGQARKGKDYALFFAVSEYEDKRLQNLPQAIENVNSLAEVLDEKYGFQTQVIHNPKLDDIDDALETCRRRFEQGQWDRDGQLLVFFTGHGVKEYENGYFLPADADIDKILRTGFSYNTWRPFISQINCRHILVAIDACYSVAFDPNWGTMSGPGFGRKGEYADNKRKLLNHEAFTCRAFFTSDAREDVVPGRSNFARKFLEGLISLQGQKPFFSSDKLFADYIDLAQPPPLAGVFENDDPRSSFLFFPVSELEVDAGQLAQQRKDIDAYEALLSRPSVEGCQNYLDGFPNGAFRAEVSALLNRLKQEEQEWRLASLKRSVESYRRYLGLFPGGKYANEARTAIGMLGGEEAPGETKNALPRPVKPEMAWIEAGSFQIGDQYGNTDVRPPKEINISSFYLSPHEVTFEQYDLYCEDMDIGKPSDEGWGRGRRPVVNVNWFDAVRFCNWMSEQFSLAKAYTIGDGGQVEVDWSANGYRLPTEAEWEYAASFSSNGEKANFGNGKSVADPREINFDGSESYKEPYSVVGQNRKQTVPAGSLNNANELGLYDMSGNVREWCWDWYDSDYYRIIPDQNSRGPATGSRRVLRGGSFDKGPGLVRTFVRSSFPPAQKYKTIGFRLARSGN